MAPASQCRLCPLLTSQSPGEPSLQVTGFLGHKISDWTVPIPLYCPLTLHCRGFPCDHRAQVRPWEQKELSLLSTGEANLLLFIPGPQEFIFD